MLQSHLAACVPVCCRPQSGGESIVPAVGCRPRAM